MTPFAIAGIQMHVLPERNIDGVRQRLKLLMHYYPWVEMVLLSELAPFGSSLHYAQALPGPHRQGGADPGLVGEDVLASSARKTPPS